MKFGFGTLKLSSNEFWAMTPRELQAAYAAFFDAANSASPLSQNDLASLMEKFPDKEVSL